MLSRVAERVYWFARYMERIESSARLLMVNSNLHLDLPRRVKIGWDSLVDITGIPQAFYERFQNADERNVARFLLTDRSTGSSIAGALALARENARTTRDIMPAEVFELVNDLYLLVQDEAGAAVARNRRQQFLVEVIRHCQELNGLIGGSLAHNTTRDFIVIGRSLERADMTSRIVDVGSGDLLKTPAERSRSGDVEALEPFENVLWMNVLRSLNAFQMYRQHVRERVSGPDVVAFLLQNGLHPRSVVRCLATLDDRLEGLPRNDRARAAAAAAQRRVWEADFAALPSAELHEFIDELQRHLAGIHEAISATWFLPRH
jgi:uncharacterized alpha-E superfamily protein